MENVFHFAAALGTLFHHRIRKLLDLLKTMMAFCAEVLVERQAKNPLKR
jgi:hypothetical protein